MMQKLNEIKKKNPFKVPENYFEEVNRKIISATTGYDQDVRKIEPYKRLISHLAIAASVAGFIILSYTAVKLLTPGKIYLHLSEVTYENFSEIIINDIDLLTLEENAASLIFFKEGPDISGTEIIDYLLLENIEIDDIYEQL